LAAMHRGRAMAHCPHVCAARPPPPPPPPPTYTAAFYTTARTTCASGAAACAAVDLEGERAHAAKGAAQRLEFFAVARPAAQPTHLRDAALKVAELGRQRLRSGERGTKGTAGKWGNGQADDTRYFRVFRVGASALLCVRYGACQQGGLCKTIAMPGSWFQAPFLSGRALNLLS